MASGASPGASLTLSLPSVLLLPRSPLASLPSGTRGTSSTRTTNGSVPMASSIVMFDCHLCFVAFVILLSLILGRHIDAIDQSLHILWSAPTDHEFTTALGGFLNYWSTTWQLYASYFHKQWVENCPPTEWALFGRQPGILLLEQITFQFIYL